MRVHACTILRTSVARSVDFVLATSEGFLHYPCFSKHTQALIASTDGLNSSKPNYLIVVEVCHTLIVPELLYIFFFKRKKKGCPQNVVVQVVNLVFWYEV